MAQEVSLGSVRSNAIDDSESSVDRSIDDIKQDIERTRQNISGTVDTLGAKLHDQLDWREYVRRRPFVAVGVGLGAGLIISRMVVRKPKRSSIADLISDTVAKTARQIILPREESVVKGAFKMLAGLAITQVAQSFQVEPGEEEHFDHQSVSRNRAV